MLGAARKGVGLLAALTLGACASNPDAPDWGADATVSPGFERVGEAAVEAAKDPVTWGPALGAAAFRVSQTDDDVSEWAREDNPVFGSRDSAQTASDVFRYGSLGAYATAGALAPAPEDAWLKTKAKGFSVGGAAILATAGTTQGLKAGIDRERPNGGNERSFPSGHTASSAVGTRLAQDTLRYYDLNARQGTIANVGLAGLTTATGWARVEAGSHYPSDVLAGAALGNFVAVFTTKAFLEPTAGDGMKLGVAPVDDGMMMQLDMSL